MAISLARIKVERNGHVILDGGPVTLTQLKKALVALKNAKGRIRYYREGSTARDVVWKPGLRTSSVLACCSIPAGSSAKTSKEMGFFPIAPAASRQNRR